jgi:hypothetical protein
VERGVVENKNLGRLMAHPGPHIRRCLTAMLALVAGMSLVGAEEAGRQSLPGLEEARAVCRYVAARGPEIASELVADGDLDANNDGRNDAVRVGVGIGTMRGNVLEVRPRGAPRESDPINVTRDEAAWPDHWGFGARWLRHAGRTYTLYFEAETLRNFVALGTIDSRNIEHHVCAFRNIVREDLRPIGNDVAELCRSVVRSEVKYTALDDRDEATNRRETRLQDRVNLDFRNIGQKETLALLNYSTGAGRGCEFQYYDTISGDWTGASGEARDLLMKLQGIDLSAASRKEYVEPSEPKLEPYLDPPNCGNTARWFEHRGRVYLDNFAKHDDGLRPRFHNVALVQGKRVTFQCKGRFAVKWEVESMGPSFR